MTIDFQTAYFAVFGTLILYGGVIFFLDWLGRRQQRRTRQPHK